MQNIQRIVVSYNLKHLAGISSYCTKTPLVLNVDLAAKIFSFPDQESAYNYARSTPIWNKLKPENATKSFELLRSFGRSAAEIQEQPNVLMKSPSSLKARQSVLAEANFREVTVLHLIKFLQLMRSSVRALKLDNFIPEDVDVAGELCRHLHLEPFLPDRKIEEQPLVEVRRRILDVYLQRELGFSAADLQSLWKEPKLLLRHPSFRMMHRTVRLLRDRLGFEPKRIIRNPLVLYSAADNIETLLERFPTLGGRDTAEVLRTHPRLLVIDSEHIAAVLDELHLLGIPEEAVRRRFEIFNLSIATLRARLTELKQVPEFDIFRANPRILRLVTYQNRTKARLDYLKQINFAGASLDMLVGSEAQFERYVRERRGNKGSNDLLHYLERALGRPAVELRKKLARHDHWQQTVLTDVLPRLELLRRHGFGDEDIFECVWLLFYPRQTIEAKLKEVETLRDAVVDLTNLTPAQRLSLCFYLIERQYHFTGDGVWQSEARETQAVSGNSLQARQGEQIPLGNCLLT